MTIGQRAPSCISQREKKQIGPTETKAPFYVGNVHNRPWMFQGDDIIIIIIANHWNISYLSFQRRHIRSLGTFRRLEIVFFKLSMVSSLLTLSSNWPPVVGATVREMTGRGGNSADDDDEPAADERWPQRQVAAPALTAASVLSTT